MLPACLGLPPAMGRRSVRGEVHVCTVHTHMYNRTGEILSKKKKKISQRDQPFPSMQICIVSTSTCNLYIDIHLVKEFTSLFRMMLIIPEAEQILILNKYVGWPYQSVGSEADSYNLDSARNASSS